MGNSIGELAAQADLYESEGPIPLIDEVSEPSEFPVESLGPILKKAVLAIQAKVQAPTAIGAQSVLAATTEVLQNYVDVELPTGAVKPCSLYLLTIATSGERKSTCDSLAMAPIKAFERDSRMQYEQEHAQWKNSLDLWEIRRNAILKGKDYKAIEAKASALGQMENSPTKPIEPVLTCEEPTYAALCKTLENGFPGIGIFSDEGGEFIGGHAMSKDNKLRTIAGLSKIWDGKEIKRMRAGDGNSSMYGKRLSMHLMVQPDVASILLTDPLMQNQGFLSRFLFAYPKSTMGQRLWNRADPAHDVALAHYQARMSEILSIPLPLEEGRRNELKPRIISLSRDAYQLWVAFHDEIEPELQVFGELRDVSGFASKLAENAVRLAAVIGGFEDPDIAEIDGKTMASGIELAQYYLSETKRLFLAAPATKSLKEAQLLLNWLHNKWKLVHIALPEIMARGPNPLRSKTKAEQCLKILEEHRWLIPASGPAKINGKKRNKAWRVVCPDGFSDI